MASVGSLWQWLVDQLYRWILLPAGIQPTDVAWFMKTVPQFLIIVALFVVVAKVMVWVLDRTFLSRRRVDPMISNLVERLLQVLMGFLAFSVGLLVFGINIFDLALTLGLVGAALALGLQNTVANIMGGISLVTDRPFEVGDRVKVGEYWGDVEEIGLRSTRILTTRREYVVIPNRLMDEREIWNYTQRYPELRVDVPISISYDSDIGLARSLMLEAAESHPEVLAFPRPEVIVKGFGESSVEMDLRAFLGSARNMYPIESEILEGIKKRFDTHGVEIPFPYRTLVYKRDLPEPAGQGAPASPAPTPSLRKRKILVATAGTTPALNKCQTIADMARELHADIVVAFIVPKSSLITQREGERAADIFSTAANRAGVDVQLVIREGQLVETIARLVRNEGCGAVVIGAPRSPVLLAWKSADVEDRLRDRLDVPIVVVPPSLEVDQAQVEAARESLDRIAPLHDDEPGSTGEAPPP